jgi:NADH-quinone oxidoreductase subunit H
LIILLDIFFVIIKTLLLLVPILSAVAYLTLVERKVLASIQRRIGPDSVGFPGLSQPIADAAKLIVKETVLPRTANTLLFILSPISTFFLSLSGWAVVPMNQSHVIADIDLGVLHIFAVSSLSVYGIIIAGWSSDSRYAFSGALRSAAQMISYEVSIGLILINVVLCVGSLNLSKIVAYQEHVWLIFPLFPLALLFFVSALAETNRTPFDLPEAEGEIVAGYNVEYSSIVSTSFYISEYANIILLSTLTVLFFSGGWMITIPSFLITFFLAFIIPFGGYTFLIEWLKNIFPITFIQDGIELNLGISSGLILALKVTCILFLPVRVRAAFPRYRYDQLMRLGWKVFLPLSLGFVIFTAGLIYAMEAYVTKF